MKEGRICEIEYRIKVEEVSHTYVNQKASSCQLTGMIDSLLGTLFNVFFI